MFVVLSVDAMDVSGEQQIDVDHNIFKQRLDEKGDIIQDKPEKEGDFPFVFPSIYFELIVISK